MVGNIQSHFKIVISGINLSSDFIMNDTPHGNHVCDVNCKVGERGTVVITGIINGEDKNENFLIAEDLKEYFIKLFSLFGVSCRIKEFEIDTTTDFLTGHIEVSPPKPVVDGSKINAQTGKVASQYLDPQKSALYHNLVESNNSIDMLHRFRSLFSVFDSLSPKNAQGHIDYHALKTGYATEIAVRYQGAFIGRYIDIVDEFCNANLEDVRANKNYSSLLKNSKQRLGNSSLIDEEVAFNLLKCIQIIRNKVNHGDFSGLNRKIVSGAYELLLPMVQKMLCA
ncbi:hypothetical protein D3P08_00185 [Paenibacillus nanensis]|uniref:Apea-like HEPN domain-containing protein n=1 Tax=Paenibacillus nanensis TaxID=393251 RepID=A0A3A1VGN1_9BACL|nr:hypothetical protein [Paenibacillus nanensis]RIX60049.1 hypothetical protein D3P08_00185 [Paenibacillus nanensis]